MTNESPFWADVRIAIDEVRATVARQSQQPSDASIVYITSILKRGSDPDRKTGVLSLTPIKIAAQRIVEGTHRVSDDSEIEAYRSAEAEKRKAMLSVATAGKSALVFAAEPKPAVTQ